MLLRNGEERGDGGNALHKNMERGNYQECSCRNCFSRRRGVVKRSREERKALVNPVIWEVTTNRETSPQMASGYLP